MRLEKKEYIDNAVTIVGYSKKEKEILAQSTIFVTEYDLYKKVFFWEGGTKGVLNKKYLIDYKSVIGDLCVTLGYTQIVNRLRSSKKDILIKGKLVQMFFGLVNSLIHELSLFVHVEPCGVCLVEDQFLENDILMIGNDIVSKLGCVDLESIVSYKIAEKLGMTQMSKLYHDSTLGPVFFSRYMSS